MSTLGKNPYYRKAIFDLYCEGEKGVQKRNIEVVRNLKNAGVDVEIISKSTGLSIEEVEKL